MIVGRPLVRQELDTKTKRLRDLLLKRQKLTAAQLDQSIDDMARGGLTLSQSLVRAGLISEAELIELLAQETGLPTVSLLNTALDPNVIRMVSAKIAHHYRLVPTGWEGNKLKLAVALPLSLEELDELPVVLRQSCSVAIAAETDVDQALKAHYGIGAETLEKLSADAQEPSQARADTEHVIDAAEEASVIKFVNQLFLEAYQRRATDIHLEPQADGLRVRYRIDGLLYEARIAESLKHFRSAVISRIKVMAELSIAERRLPQDGRIRVKVEDKEMDLRVSVLPTPHGESISIRFLTSSQLLDLAYLGFSPRDLETLQSYLAKPHGILFLTGPTGSGKTTTLYAMLSRINDSKTKIITIEDPIEYQLPGVTQVQVRPKIGLTFAQGLRSMLRHDPDVMMVGEVRDLETAEIAIRVALTGHLVLSTLHTNDASSAVPRLQDIGVEPYLASSSLRCVVAQRLVRLICPECKTAVPLTPDLQAEFPWLKGLPATSVSLGKGCESCQQTGFRGRTVIYEILLITREIREMIVQRTPAGRIRQKAIEQGMKTLRECGWEKVARGLTTPQEVIRATLQEDA